jgi:hypothetical protein
MEICWGSRVALDQLLIGSHIGEREREREREKEREREHLTILSEWEQPLHLVGG